MFSLDGLELDGAMGAQETGAQPPTSPSPGAEAFLYDDSSASDGSLYGSDRENHLHISACKQLVVKFYFFVCRIMADFRFDSLSVNLNISK